MHGQELPLSGGQTPLCRLHGPQAPLPRPGRTEGASWAQTPPHLGSFLGGGQRSTVRAEDHARLTLLALEQGGG